LVWSPPRAAEGQQRQPAQSKAKITAAWRGSSTPRSRSVRSRHRRELQHAQAHPRDADDQPQAQQIKAKVTDITLSGDTSAKVTYDIISTQNNTALLPGAAARRSSRAATEVTVKTFCSLIKLADQNAKCPEPRS